MEHPVRRSLKMVMCHVMVTIAAAGDDLLRVLQYDPDPETEEIVFLNFHRN